MLKFIKKLKSIVSSYDKDLQQAHKRITELEKVLAERTSLNADVGYQRDNHIIVVGRYKNNDYVQTYTVRSEDLSSFIDQLRSMEKYGHIKMVDAPPQFRAAFKRDLF